MFFSLEKQPLPLIQQSLEGIAFHIKQNTGSHDVIKMMREHPEKSQISLFFPLIRFLIECLQNKCPLLQINRERRHLVVMHRRNFHSPGWINLTFLPL